VNAAHSRKMSGTCSCKILDAETITCKELCTYFKAKRISHDAIGVFREQRICGKQFLKMNWSDICNLLPGLGDRVKVKNLLCHVRASFYKDILCIVCIYNVRSCVPVTQRTIKYPYNS